MDEGRPGANLQADADQRQRGLLGHSADCSPDDCPLVPFDPRGSPSSLLVFSFFDRKTEFRKEPDSGRDGWITIGNGMRRGGAIP